MIKLDVKKANKIINFAILISIILCIAGVFSACKSMAGDSITIWSYLVDLAFFGYLAMALILVKIIRFGYLKLQKRNLKNKLYRR
jgi:hypothetical protein